MARTLICPDNLPKYGIDLGDRRRKVLETADKFPKRVPVTARTYAYVEDEILAYTETRIIARDKASEAA